MPSPDATQILTRHYHGCNVVSTLDPAGERWETVMVPDPREPGEYLAEPGRLLADGWTHLVTRRGASGEAEVVGEYPTLAEAIAAARASGS
jgi:hypothetical protein